MVGNLRGLGRRQRRAFLLGVALLAGGSSQAHGFFGYGFMGGFNYVPSPGDFVNQHALSNAARAGKPPSNNVYAGNPNSYLNRVRDPGFVSSYDVARRTPAASRPSPRVSPGERIVEQTATAPAAAPRPVVPLASFFNQAKTLVWPGNAPVEGELQQKRDISDASTLLVLGELQAQGRATIGSVTDSRQKLIDYGQPALQLIRTNSTARVADTFHLFLLSLYESLAQAASPAAIPSAATP
jgi:hypothetical protein